MRREHNFWKGALHRADPLKITLMCPNSSIPSVCLFSLHLRLLINSVSVAHPCNMREFKIFIGMNREYLTEVLHSGLKNDSVPETFSIKFVNDAGICFPTRFVKIEPISYVPFYNASSVLLIFIHVESAHGQSFHISIWHVSMTGIADEAFVEHVQISYDEVRSLLFCLQTTFIFCVYQPMTVSRSNCTSAYSQTSTTTPPTYSLRGHSLPLRTPI